MHTYKTGTETSNTQSNVEGQPNSTSSEIAHNEQWGKSPIWIRGNNEIGYFATIGNNRISEKYIIKEALESILPHPETVEILLNAAVNTMEKWMEMEIKRMNEEYEKSKEKEEEKE